MGGGLAADADSLVNLHPEVIVALSGAAQRATNPIVFVGWR